jgi:hypothetical protein
MFTFLPKEYRSEVLKEYRKRVFSIAFGFLALLGLAAVILSIPAYVIISAKKTSVTLTSKSNSVAADEAANALFETRLKQIQTETAELNKISDKQSILSVIDLVNRRVVPGIRLTGMTFGRTESGVGAINLAGMADTRDALVSFSKSLKGEPTFLNISLPVSALAKGKDIVFSITIDSKF